jgi:hypothetical protein
MGDLRVVVDRLSLRAAARGASHATLQVISPLAEGADRIVARSALEQGAELIVLLPFPPENYLLDFSTSESREEFLELLGRAHEIVELGGRRDSEASRNLAYSQVGEILVARSDVLIALWDGKPASGAGGTAQVIDMARRVGRPIFWLPTSTGPEASISKVPRLLQGNDTTTANAVEAFSAIVNRLLARQL